MESEERPSPHPLHIVHADIYTIIDTVSPLSVLVTQVHESVRTLRLVRSTIYPASSLLINSPLLTASPSDAFTILLIWYVACIASIPSSYVDPGLRW